jgi:hypothetical protein
VLLGAAVHAVLAGASVRSAEEPEPD